MVTNLFLKAGNRVVCLLLIIGFLAGCVKPRTHPPSPVTSPSKVGVTTVAKPKVPVTKPAPTRVATVSPRYELVYTLEGHRYDGGAMYYVLIPSINLADAKFKETIKAVIRDIVAKKGGKVSMEIYDSRSALARMYEISQSKRLRTTADERLVATHYPAAFDGQLDTQVYPNTLTFFPLCLTSTPTVGKYVDCVEFNP